MDASAFVSKEQWEDILSKNLCDEVDIRCAFLSINDDFSYNCSLKFLNILNSYLGCTLNLMFKILSIFSTAMAFFGSS